MAEYATGTRRGYGIGDHVRIRRYLEPGREYDGCLVTGDMDERRGDVALITGVRGPNRYRISDSAYNWTAEMFYEGTLLETDEVSHNIRPDVQVYRGGHIPLGSTNSQIINGLTTKENTTMNKYYKVVKEHPELELGAVLTSNGGNYYHLIDQLWAKYDRYEGSLGATVPAHVVETSDWFERVYPIGTESFFGTKKQALDALNSAVSAPKAKSNGK